jgi:hypothetical protein
MREIDKPLLAVLACALAHWPAPLLCYIAEYAREKLACVFTGKQHPVPDVPIDNADELELILSAGRVWLWLDGSLNCIVGPQQKIERVFAAANVRGSILALFCDYRSGHFTLRNSPDLNHWCDFAKVSGPYETVLNARICFDEPLDGLFLLSIREPKVCVVPRETKPIVQSWLPVTALHPAVDPYVLRILIHNGRGFALGSSGFRNNPTHESAVKADHYKADHYLWSFCPNTGRPITQVKLRAGNPPSVLFAIGTSIIVGNFGTPKSLSVFDCDSLRCLREQPTLLAVLALTRAPGGALALVASARGFAVADLA